MSQDFDEIDLNSATTDEDSDFSKADEYTTPAGEIDFDSQSTIEYHTELETPDQFEDIDFEEDLSQSVTPGLSEEQTPQDEEQPEVIDFEEDVDIGEEDESQMESQQLSTQPTIEKESTQQTDISDMPSTPSMSETESVDFTQEEDIGEIDFSEEMEKPSENEKGKQIMEKPPSSPEVISLGDDDDIDFDEEEDFNNIQKPTQQTSNAEIKKEVVSSEKQKLITPKTEPQTRQPSIITNNQPTYASTSEEKNEKGIVGTSVQDQQRFNSVHPIQQVQPPLHLCAPQKPPPPPPIVQSPLVLSPQNIPHGLSQVFISGTTGQLSPLALNPLQYAFLQGQLASANNTSIVSEEQSESQTKKHKLEVKLENDAKKVKKSDDIVIHSIPRSEKKISQQKPLKIQLVELLTKPSRQIISTWKFTLEEFRLAEGLRKSGLRRRHIPYTNISLFNSIHDQINLYNWNNSNLQHWIPELKPEQLYNLTMKFIEKKKPDTELFQVVFNALFEYMKSKGLSIVIVLATVTDEDESLHIQVFWDPPISEKPVVMWLCRMNDVYFDSLVIRDHNTFKSSLKLIQDRHILGNLLVSPPDETPNPYEYSKKLQLILDDTTKRTVSFGSSNIYRMINEWRQRIKNINNKIPVIMFVGESRCGKSTLLNSILEGGFVLPTSADAACTSVIVEISYDSEYIAEVEFMSRQEWKEEHRKLNEIVVKGKGEQLEHARLQLTALHGTKNWKPYQPIPKKVYNMLNPRPLIYKSKDPQELGKWIKKYAASSGANEPQYWPIIKVCRIKGPFKVLDCGLKLVDVPGLHDSNVARENITRKYIQQAQFICIVSMYNNLANSPTIRHLLSHYVIPNGIKLAIIATMIDNINVHDVKYNHKLPNTARKCEVIRFEANRLRELAHEIILDELEKYKGNITNFRNQEIASVPFFSVAAFQYQLKVKDDPDFNKRSFPHIELTGIPSLQRWLRDQTQDRLSELFTLKKSIRNVNEKSVTKDIHIKQYDQQEKELLKKIVDTVKQSVREYFLNPLIVSAEQSIPQDVIQRWRREMNFSTFQAACVRGGRFTSLTRKSTIDLNEELAEKVIEMLAAQMTTFYGHNASICAVESLMDQMIDLFKATDISKLLPEGELKPLLLTLKQDLRSTLQQDRQRVLDTLKSCVQKHMLNYTPATSVRSGSGKFDRMIEALKMHVSGPASDMLVKVVDTTVAYLYLIAKRFEQYFGWLCTKAREANTRKAQLDLKVLSQVLPIMYRQLDAI